MDEERIKDLMGWCKHYDGIGGYSREPKKHCKAGVVYLTVLENVPGKGTRYPCIKDQAGDTHCDKAEYPTREEAIAAEAESERRGAQYMANLANNICPICERPIRKKRQIGRCVYADPCGHRLYQGTV